MSPRDKTRSLSHKLDRVVAVSAPDGWQVGIDLEQIRPRDVTRLSAWMASEPEAAASRRLPAALALRHFYRLWTFKEAMIKARSQDFPADLKTNALLEDPDSGAWQIHAAGSEGWSVRVFESGDDWMLTVVWRAPGAESADVAWELVSDAPAQPFALTVAVDGRRER